MSSAPIAGLKYFRYFTIFRIIPVACEKKAPVIRKGIPSPMAYASNELYAAPGAVAAKVKVLPKIGPTQGVHPAAKRCPENKRRDIACLKSWYFSHFFLKVQSS